MSRREFTRKQREQITDRARNASGEVCCERCGLVLTGKRREIDHIIPEALRPEADKQEKITITEGQLLGECCHRGPDGKTNTDVKQIAKGNRQNAKQFARQIIDNPKPLQGAPMPTSRKALERKQRASTKSALPPRLLFAPARKRWQSGDTHDAD